MNDDDGIIMVQLDDISCEAITKNNQNIANEITILKSPSFTNDCVHYTSNLQNVVCKLLIGLQTTAAVHLVNHTECLTNRMTLFVTHCIHTVISIQELITICNLIKPIEICVK